MKERQRTVFYCDFCRKHGLSRHAMRAHEIRCTMNPFRVCSWHEPKRGQNPLDVLARRLRERPGLTEQDIFWLHDAVDGCPACMLAALRQSGVEYHYDSNSHRIFDYETAVKEYREAEREAEQRREYAEMF